VNNATMLSTKKTAKQCYNFYDNGAAAKWGTGLLARQLVSPHYIFALDFIFPSVSLITLSLIPNS